MWRTGARAAHLLELLERQDVGGALTVLRAELAPSGDPDKLHSLSTCVGVAFIVAQLTKRVLSD